MDSLQQPKKKEVMGTARSYFYVVGSTEYSHPYQKNPYGNPA